VHHVIQWSGGIGSWATAELVRQDHPDEPITLLFADVQIEDSDLYRFNADASQRLGVPITRLTGVRAGFRPMESDSGSRRRSLLSSTTPPAADEPIVEPDLAEVVTLHRRKAAGTSGGDCAETGPNSRRGPPHRRSRAPHASFRHQRHHRDGLRPRRPSRAQIHSPAITSLTPIHVGHPQARSGASSTRAKRRNSHAAVPEVRRLFANLSTPTGFSDLLPRQCSVADSSGASCWWISAVRACFGPSSCRQVSQTPGSVRRA
jgi:hypothetical protein